MPTIFTRPDTYAEEVQQVEGLIVAARTGYGRMQAVTQKGPPGALLITRTRSFDAWKRIHGERESVARGDAAYEAKMFFDEGGVELLTNRQVHYADLADKTSYTGLPATTTCITEGVAATAASKTGAIGPYDLEPADKFTLGLDGGGALDVQFDATDARVNSGATVETYDFTALGAGPWPMTVVVNGASQVVTFQVADFVAPAAATALEVLARINNDITQAEAHLFGAGPNFGVEISTDKRGTDATLTVTAGPVTTLLGLTVPVASTGNVGNIDAVTAQEVVDEATTVHATLIGTVNANGSFTLTSPTLGAASELNFTLGLAALGLVIEDIFGTAAGATFSTLKLSAGYLGYESPGVAGNTLKRQVTHNPAHPTAGVGLDLADDASSGSSTIEVTTLQGLVAGSVLKLWDGANTEYPVVRQVRAVVSAGTVKFYVDIVTALTNTYLKAASQLQSREFDLSIYDGDTFLKTYRRLSLLSTANDYYVTVLNDDAVGSEYVVAEDLVPAIPVGARLPAQDSVPVSFSGGTDETIGMVDADWIGNPAGTGVRAFDQTSEFSPMALIGNNNAAVVHAADQYARSRMWVHNLTYANPGMTGTEVIAYRNSVLGLDSSYTFLYAGGAKVYDPDGVGSYPKRSISGLGGVMGDMARVDNLPSPNGGPWNAPAGEGDYGTLRSALDVATVYTDEDHGPMNDAGVNVIRKFGPMSPVMIWGQRTLYANPDKKWDSIPVRRFFSWAEKSIVDSTRWTVFKNNDFRLWDKLVSVVEGFFRNLLPQRAFPTTDAKKAYKIRCGVEAGTMTQDDVNNHKTVCEVGLAKQVPNEFTVFQFAQFEGGSSVTEV